ncbi:ATP-binding cassette subfamily C protein CydC [Natronospira proteinivora]|uniref:ATP-binding cassette subfamily C protein CydC n=1 Tax=Natronospira proteinivora TaxID=1807133 RepID=A0ABT1G5D5_9GAMM|nr:ATP-binding cassette domain-containing protein [Natronospira proteinivora]MCP1726506.1 ATP-binding cassette subfamily C protein CydC [Natronospira proteinivora]
MRTERARLDFLLRTLPRGRQGWLWAAFALALIAGLSSVGLVATAGWLITASGLAGAAAALGAAITLEIFAPGALIRLFAVSRTVGRYLERLLVHEAVFRILARLRQGIFLRHARLPFQQLSQLRDGPLLARLMGDVQRLEHFHASLLIPLLTVLATGLILAVFVALLDRPTAGLLILATLLLAMGLIRRFLRRQSDGEARQALDQANQRSQLSDVLAAHRELQFSDPDERWLQKVIRREERIQQRESRLARQAARLDAALQLLPALGLLGLLVLALRDNSEPAWLAMSVLGLLALGGLFSGLGPAMRRWGGIQVACRRLSPASHEMPIIDRGPDQSTADKESAPPAEWSLTSVSLRRGLTDRPILDQASLTIPPERRLAVVGPSGSGKSRFAQLLTGLIEPDGGSVHLNGRPVGDWPEAQRFARIGVLEQRSTLLEATLRHNLSMANPTLSDSTLLAAMSATGLDQAGLGLDDWVGEQTRPLSGGETRRVALIRIVLSPARTLILDEPFRGLDANTRERVLFWLEQQLKGRGLVLLDHQAPDRWVSTSFLHRTVEIHNGQFHHRQ